MGGKSDFRVKVALLGSIGDGRGSAELSWPLPVLQLINKTDGLFLKKKKPGEAGKSLGRGWILHGAAEAGKRWGKMKIRIKKWPKPIK